MEIYFMAFSQIFFCCFIIFILFYGADECKIHRHAEWARQMSRHLGWRHTSKFTSQASKTRPNGNSKSGKSGGDEKTCNAYNVRPVKPLTGHCACTANCKLPCCVWAANQKRSVGKEISTCLRQPAFPSTFCMVCKCANGSCRMAKVSNSFFCGERFFCSERGPVPPPRVNQNTYIKTNKSQHRMEESRCYRLLNGYSMYVNKNSHQADAKLKLHRRPLSEFLRCLHFGKQLKSLHPCWLLWSAMTSPCKRI